MILVLLSIAWLAGSAFAAHCINESKVAGAGVQGAVLLDRVVLLSAPGPVHISIWKV